MLARGYLPTGRRRFLAHPLAQRDRGHDHWRPPGVDEAERDLHQHFAWGDRAGERADRGAPTPPGPLGDPRRYLSGAAGPRFAAVSAAERRAHPPHCRSHGWRVPAAWSLYRRRVASLCQRRAVTLGNHPREGSFAGVGRTITSDNLEDGGNMIIKRVATFKRPADFQAYLAELGIDLACDDTLVVGSASPLWQPFEVYGRRVGNRWATQPMEGWDGTTDGGVTENVLRRWRRFGESGAKLIWGGEAMAIRPEGRANPNQLIINEEHAADLALLRETLLRSHQEHFGRVDDLIVGFQLTHSGRYCRPFPDRRPCPRVAYRHPILDARVGVTSDAPVIPDEEIPSLVDDYVQAARVARRAGADFVDVKHCHGYLLHEFLSARTRPGPYGGSFENRTRLLREIIAGIRAEVPD